MLENLHKIGLTSIEKAPVIQPNIYSLDCTLCTNFNNVLVDAWTRFMYSLIIVALLATKTWWKPTIICPILSSRGKKTNKLPARQGGLNPRFFYYVSFVWGQHLVSMILGTRAESWLTRSCVARTGLNRGDKNRVILTRFFDCNSWRLKLSENFL